MKKIAMLLVAAVCSVAAWATDYTGALTVTVNGNSSSQATTITINKEANGTYDFLLKNFVLEAGGQKMGVGNIELKGLNGTTAYGFTTVTYNDSVQISAGDDASISTWLGPLLGKVPVRLTSQFNDQAMNVTIDIDMQSTLQQTIKVGFIGTTPAVLAGDVNGDGKVSLPDVTALVNLLLQ